MAPRRLFVPGLSHHVRHRGNNRGQIFRDDDDRSTFLAMLGRACRRRGVRLHGYSLMDNHYHALLAAPDEESLPRLMQSLGRAYVRHFNARHQRTGTLWEGRYWASLVTDERYWLTCLRYIERNPVEAGIVETPDAYAWSSHRYHALGHPNALLTTHSLYEALGARPADRRATWAAHCAEAVAKEQAAIIWEALRTSTPLEEPKVAITANIVDLAATGT